MVVSPIKLKVHSDAVLGAGSALAEFPALFGYSVMGVAMLCIVQIRKARVRTS